MTKKWTIRGVLLVLLLLATVWLIYGNGNSLVVEGNLSTGDIKEITSVVRRDMRHYISTNCTLAEVKGLPRLLLKYVEYRPICIEYSGSGYGYVSLKRNYSGLYADYIVYKITKSPGGWAVADPGPQPF